MIYNKSITATVYIVKDNRILLHKHKKYNTWFPVGGHLKPNELPHEAAIREAKEETGLDIVLFETEHVANFDIGRVERIPEPFCLYHEADIDEQFLDFIFIGISSQQQVAPPLTESQEIRWFSREELETAEIKIHVKNTALEILNFNFCCL